MTRSTTKAARSVADQCSPLLDLPLPLLELVLSFLPTNDLSAAGSSCSILATCTEGAVIAHVERLDIRLHPNEGRTGRVLKRLVEEHAKAERIREAERLRVAATSREPAGLGMLSVMRFDTPLQCFSKFDGRVVWLHRHWLAVFVDSAHSWQDRCKAVEVLIKALRARPTLEVQIVRNMIERLTLETSGVTRGAVLDLLAELDEDTWLSEGLAASVLKSCDDTNKIARTAAFRTTAKRPAETLIAHAAQVLSHVKVTDLQWSSNPGSINLWSIQALARKLDEVYDRLDGEGRDALDALRAVFSKIPYLLRRRDGQRPWPADV